MIFLDLAIIDHRNYIIQKIKPHFIFPSNLPTEYSTNRGKIKMLVTVGFLIDGKVNENGFITTKGFSNWNQIKDAIENGIDLNYPIFIPKGKEFFIGISLYTDKDDSDFKIKVLENGKYDKSGNLISFPSNVETKMFTNGEVYTNKLLKIDLYMNVYNTEIKPTIELGFQETSESFSSDRVMLFSTDFYPTNTILNYGIKDSSNQITTLKKNDENIFDITTTILPNIIIEMSTNDKYVSPIVNLNGLNLVNKTYTTETKRVSITSQINEFPNQPAKISTFKFTIDNIDCWNGNYVQQINYYIPNEVRNYIDMYLYLLRVDFDFHLNHYGYDVVKQATSLIDINAINKLTGERYKIYSGDFINNKLSTLDGNRIDVVDLDEYGWKRANCEHILMWIIDPESIKNNNAKIYPFINYPDQFKFEVSIHIVNNNDNIIGVEAVKNITCSLDSLVASTSKKM